ncbi:MAG TPA: dTDP-4-dehydrorhamnose reductase [Chitinophagaceae bacterium]|nr:dTDP-4-dehydrorhamnose reductase [Chitinophagaceae bacterium]
MPEPVILITGASGQLGAAIKALSSLYPQFHFIFLAKEDLPVNRSELVQQYFKNVLPAFCINCAAYTAVDKAETEKELAMLVNGDAVGVLAAACKSFHAKFIHISTDYVFDGTAVTPYKEEDNTNPVNYYGKTKLRGEELSIQNNNESIVIRTSWLYAEYGNNFVKTMVRLMKERSSLNVVNDQLGSPTYAGDLAKLILGIIAENQFEGRWVPGIYHYSNEGVISWYDFAVAIKNLIQSDCAVHPIPASMYPTPAKRPAYSVMNKEKIRSVYGVAVPAWENSLSECISHMQQ